MIILDYLEKKMIVHHRSDQIYCLCVLCLCAIFFVSIYNIIYLLRHSFSTKTLFHAKHSSQKTETISRQTPNETDAFQEFYMKLLQSFSYFYVPLLENQTSSISYCPPVPPDLIGRLNVSQVPDDFHLTNLSSYHLNVSFGGYFQPKNCVARHRVALIVPYRDRPEILKHFLFHTHQILQRQQLDYQIYVCEQAYNQTFNKGIVMNSCFKEILQLQPSTPCFIMHDVDLLLTDDRNMYTCPPTYPRHLSVAIDKFNFYLPYPELVGGVLAMRREHFLLVNGYSTNYWGWGAEDDDMHARIVNKGLKVERPHVSIARYNMLKHTHQKLNPQRMKVLRNSHIRINSDGVNNVNYRLLRTDFFHLYTYFLIDVGNAPN